MGDVKTRLQNAQRLINQHAGPVMRCSHRYKSRAWGFDAEEEFSNQVLEVDTDLMPEQLLDALQASGNWGATARQNSRSNKGPEPDIRRARSTSTYSSTTTA